MIWAIVSLVALLVIPGAVIVRASGVRLPWALALGPAVTFGVAGTAGWVLGAIDVRFNLVSAAACWALVLLVALGWSGVGALIRRRGGSEDRQGRQKVQGDALIEIEAPAHSTAVGRWTELGYGSVAGIGVVIAAAVLAWTAISRIAPMAQGMETIQQGWDTLWHASVLRAITEDGMASATRMGDIQNVETQAVSYYPAAWHAFGALWALIVRLPITAVVNYLGIILPAVTIPTAAAALAWRIADRRKFSAAVAAGIAALVSAALPVLMPIGVFVGAWPYQVSIALAMTVFAFATSLPHAPQRILSVVFALIGIGELHPSSVPTVVLLGAIWWLCYRLPRPARPELGAVRARLYDVSMIVAGFAPAAAVLLPQWLSGSSLAEDVRAVSAEVEGLDRVQAWYRAATMLTRHADMYKPFWVIIVLGAIGMVFVLFTGRSTRRIWVLPAWLVSVLLTTHAIKNFGGTAGDILSTYTDLHYSTPHRLVMVTAYLFAALAGIALAWACAWLARISESRVPSTGRVLGLSLATVSSAAIVVYGVSTNAGPADFSYKTPREMPIISQADLKAFDWLAEQPEAHKYRTFTNPAEGSGWMYPRNNLPVVFPHYNWPVADGSTATAMLYWHADLLGTDDSADDSADNRGKSEKLNDVDKAARKLNVGFIYISPPNIWPFQETPPALAEGLWHAPGVTPVYRDREVTIYALNDVISSRRIDEMRASSPEVIPPSASRGWSDGRVG